MGTRHLIAVVKDGSYKIAQYGQWDGYPSGQGVDVLKFLRGADLDLFKARLDKCRFLTEADTVAINADLNGGGKTLSRDYPHLSRDAGSDILGMVLKADDGLGLVDSHKFAGDGLFCEWAYVIDLDSGELEVYGGLKTGDAPEGERFAGCREDGSEYGPVHLTAKFPLTALPTDEEFCAQLEREEEDA